VQKLIDEGFKRESYTVVLAAVSLESRFDSYYGLTKDFRKHEMGFSLDSSVPHKHDGKEVPPFNYAEGDAPFCFMVSTVSFTLLLKWIVEVLKLSLDIIRMDIEGEEIPILLGYDFDIKPAEVNVEFHGKHRVGSPERRAIEAKFEAEGYIECKGRDKWDTRFIHTLSGRYLRGPE